jgi:predicted Fe-Mo cluster-binding NifX family protein
MRIAIAITRDSIAEHFGHCDHFNVYEIDGKEVIKEEQIKNPPHVKGYLPNFLSERKIDVLITGNIGEMAVKGLEEFNIKTLRGVKGTPIEVLKCYLEDTLITSDGVCNEHQGHNH